MKVGGEGEGENVKDEGNAKEPGVTFCYGSGNVAPEDTDHYGLIFHFFSRFLVLF